MIVAARKKALLLGKCYNRKQKYLGKRATTEGVANGLLDDGLMSVLEKDNLMVYVSSQEERFLSLRMP